ncbi:MAG: hypothetical protein KGN31_07065 [Betaproteobacteria bacterium]|nr:hypothetical protein [Betaproteobacteria bacterium]HQU07231.1 hypothetical protein [Ferrovaceae bacterium]
MSLCKPILAVVVGLALGGCAVTAPKPDTQFLAKPLKVGLAQIPFQDKDAIRSVVAQDQPKDSTEAGQETINAIEAMQSQEFTDMTNALAAFPGITVNSTPVPLPTILNGFPIADRNQSLTPEVAASLRASSGADALLRFGISDYGLTPKAWRHGVIAFEVVSTLGIAAIAYARPATRAIAGAYLAQETIEETIEAYSGFWTLDEVYRPVRVEAEMIDLHTGRRVWADSETGFSDRRLSRIFRTVTDEERKAQLSAALREAINKVVSDFQKARGGS